MQSLNVVLLQRDSKIAQSLVSALSDCFPSVHTVQSVTEVRNSIGKHRVRVAILDMEAASLSDVEHLSHEFPQACIVCTHRCADEELWAAALRAGACDVCPSGDTRGIVRAAAGNAAVGQSAAA